jgi:fumarate reductase flavoprotein subunit
MTDSNASLPQNYFSKRQFLKGAATTLALGALPFNVRRALAAEDWDLVIIGGGSAGLPAAIFAAERGARVLVLEGSHRIGGTLDRSGGQMSAAGTSLQAAKGIKDSPDLHFEDVMRISKRTVNPELVRLFVDNAADTIHWLLALGWKPLPDHPVKGEGHEPYQIARYQWGPERGMSVYRALEPKVLELLQRGRLTILVETEAIDLIQHPDGRIAGVTARDQDGGKTDYRAANVLLASGGAGGDASMFQRLNGAPLYARMAYPYNRGGGVVLGESVGGYVRGTENYLCNDGGILQDADYPSPYSATPLTDPASRPPWEVYVNVHGARFTKEDDPSVDNREHAVLRQPDHRYWAIFDDQILKDAPPFLAGWTRQRMATAFGQHHMFTQAASLAGLARWIGVDAARLTATISAYNAAQAAGKDTAFGRAHMPLPIARPPFYAIRLQGYSILTYGGLAVDTSLRVMRTDGAPVPNLFAAGEVLGKGSLSGHAYVGGMSLTPALTFGRLISQRMIRLDA